MSYRNPKQKLFDTGIYYTNLINDITSGIKGLTERKLKRDQFQREQDLLNRRENLKLVSKKVDEANDEKLAAKKQTAINPGVFSNLNTVLDEKYIEVGNIRINPLMTLEQNIISDNGKLLPDQLASHVGYFGQYVKQGGDLSSSSKVDQEGGFSTYADWKMVRIAQGLQDGSLQLDTKLDMTNTSGPIVTYTDPVTKTTWNTNSIALQKLNPSSNPFYNITIPTYTKTMTDAIKAASLNPDGKVKAEVYNNSKREPVSSVKEGSNKVVFEGYTVKPNNEFIANIMQDTSLSVANSLLDPDNGSPQRFVILYNHLMDKMNLKGDRLFNDVGTAGNPVTDDMIENFTNVYTAYAVGNVAPSIIASKTIKPEKDNQGNNVISDSEVLTIATEAKEDVEQAIIDIKPGGGTIGNKRGKNYFLNKKFNGQLIRDVEYFPSQGILELSISSGQSADEEKTKPIRIDINNTEQVKLLTSELLKNIYGQGEKSGRKITNALETIYQEIPLQEQQEKTEFNVEEVISNPISYSGTAEDLINNVA
jgi:hypothetical protein